MFKLEAKRMWWKRSDNVDDALMSNLCRFLGVSTQSHWLSIATYSVQNDITTPCPLGDKRGLRGPFHIQ